MKTIIYMNSRKELLEKKIKELEKKISKFPSGLLIASKNGGSYKYYKQEHVSPGKRTRTYISSKDHSQLKYLAQKVAYTIEINNMQNELVATQKYLNSRKEPKELPPVYSKLLFSDLDNWENMEYERNTLHPENLTMKVTNSLSVRSKSEAIIAHALKAYNIPFRYECTHTIGDMKVSPDFTILKKTTKEEFLWEHFGLVDNLAYRNNMIAKLQLYIAAGYIPGKNLIVTFETKDSPLDIDYVDNLIKFHFLG